jgi:hypothetical protein
MHIPPLGSTQEMSTTKTTVRQSRQGSILVISNVAGLA